jgi:hypothetical protein
MADKEERIRIRAYQIWEREGHIDGRHQHNWEEARREIEAEDAAAGGEETAKSGKKSRRRRAAGSAIADGETKPISGRRAAARTVAAEKMPRAQAAEVTANVLKRPRSKKS